MPDVDPTPTVTLAEQVRTLTKQLATAEAERDDAVIALAKRSEQLAGMRSRLGNATDLRKSLAAAEGEIETVTAELARLKQELYACKVDLGKVLGAEAALGDKP